MRSPTSTGRLVGPVVDKAPEPAANEGSRDADDLLLELERLRMALRHRERELQEVEKLLALITTSTSWRITSPLREGNARVRRARRLLLGMAGGLPVVGPSLRAYRQAAALRALRQSCLFDERWYGRQVSDEVTRDGLLEHYLSVGWREGASPGPLFDAPWYIDSYLRGSSLEPLTHFVTRGVWSGANPNRYFDVSLWAANESDGVDPLTYLRRVASSLEDERAVDPDASSVVDARPGRKALSDGDALCIYAHYDPGGTVDDHVHAALEAAADAGLKLVLVSSCPTLDERSLDRLEPLVAYALTTTNRGRDWGLYHEGLRFATGLVRPGTVTLLNDSVYVLRPSLADLMDRVRSARYDIVGATDSYQQRHHLQSYFLHFGERAVRSPLLEDFICHYVPVGDKTYIINAHEIGLARHAAELGLTFGAVWDVAKLERAAAPLLAGRSPWPSGPVNPTHYFWDVLLDAGCPFIKVELLRDNPQQIAGVDRFEHVLRRSCSESRVSLIGSHVRRVAKA